MKKGISYWSFSEDLGDPNPAYEDVFKLAKKHGYDSVEASVASDPNSVLTFDATDADIAKVKAAADKVGIEISSVASGEYWGVSLTDPDKNVRAQAVKNVKNQIRIAAGLGCKFILIVPGAVQPQFIPSQPPVPYAECWKRATQQIKKCVATAEKHKVVIGLENVWNRFLLSPMEMLAFVQSFNSPFVKCYLDVGNVMFNGTPQDWILTLGKKHIAGIHVKDFRTHFFLGNERGKLAKVRDCCRTIAKGSGWSGAYAFCDIGEGDLPGTEVMAALKKVGYNAYMTAEMLPPYKGVVAKTSRAMNKLMGIAPKKKSAKKK